MYTDTHLYSYRALGAGLLLAFAQVLSAQVGLGLSPMRLEMKVTPGLQQSGVLILSSDSGDKVRVRAEALDFWIDREHVTSPASVRTHDPGVGMGIEFTGLPEDTRKRLQAHLDKLDPGLSRPAPKTSE